MLSTEPPSSLFWPPALFPKPPRTPTFPKSRSPNNFLDKTWIKSQISKLSKNLLSLVKLQNKYSLILQPLRQWDYDNTINITITHQDVKPPKEPLRRKIWWHSGSVFHLQVKGNSKQDKPVKRFCKTFLFGKWLISFSLYVHVLCHSALCVFSVEGCVIGNTQFYCLSQRKT